MLIQHKKNTAFDLAFPMVDSATPESFKTGLSPVDTAYYKDGTGAWTALSITDTAAEIGSTGIYEISLTAAEMNHDWVIIEFTAADAADTLITFKMFTHNIDDIIDTSIVHIWHVAKTGLDANDGHSFEKAKLTIAAAITAAAAGDTIIVWPGTYAENVNLSKQLTLMGVSRNGCIISVTSGDALTISAAGCIVKSISAITTASTKIGIKLSTDLSGLQLIDCYGEGDYDGIHLNGVSNVYMFKCRGKGKFDGLQLANGSNIIVDSCIGITDGTNTVTNYTSGIADTGATGLIIRNSCGYATRSLNGDNYHLAACRIKGEAILENVTCYVKHTGTGNHQSAGLVIADTGAVVLGRGIVSRVESNYGYIYGIWAQAGSCLLKDITIKITAGSTPINSAVTDQVLGQEKVQFVDENLSAAPDDYFNGWWITWLTGNNTGQVKEVLDWEEDPLNRMTLVSACTYDIEIGDTYSVTQYIATGKDIKQSENGVIKIANCQFDKTQVEGIILFAENDALGSAIPAKPDADSVNEAISDTRKLMRADKVVDTTKTPWVLDYKEEGTSTKLLSKTMKNTDGQSITNKNNILGRLEKE